MPMPRARGRYVWYRLTDGMIAGFFRDEQELADMLYRDILDLISLLHC